jgi:hypothetical protein
MGLDTGSQNNISDDAREPEAILSTYHNHGEIYTHWLPQHGFSSELLKQFIEDLQRPIIDERSSAGFRHPNETEQEKRYKQRLPVYLLLHKFKHLEKAIAERVVKEGLPDTLSHDLASEIPPGNESKQSDSFDRLLPKYRLMHSHKDLDKNVAETIVNNNLQGCMKHIMEPPADGKPLGIERQKDRVSIFLFAKDFPALSISVAKKIFALGLTKEHKENFAKEVITGNSVEASQIQAHKKFLPKYQLLARYSQLDPAIAYKLSCFGLLPVPMQRAAKHIATVEEDKEAQEKRLAELFIEPEMVAFWVAVENSKQVNFATAEAKLQDSSLPASQAVQAGDCKLNLIARRVLFAYYLLYPPTLFEISGQEPSMLAAGFSHAWNNWREERRLIMDNPDTDAKQKKEQLLIIKDAMKAQTDSYCKAQQGDRIAMIQTYMYNVHGFMRWCNRNRVNIALTFVVAAMVGFLFHELQPFQEMMFNNPDNYRLNAMESGVVGGCLTLFSAGVGKVTLGTFLLKAEEDENDSVPELKFA